MTLQDAIAWADASLNDRWRMVRAVTEAEHTPEDQWGGLYEAMQADAMDTLAAEVEAQQARTCDRCDHRFIAYSDTQDEPYDMCREHGEVCSQFGNTCGAFTARATETQP